MRGELHRIAVDGDAAGAGIEADRPAGEFALGVAGRAAQQRPHPRQHFFEMERLGDIVVGAGIETLHLVAPAVARGEDEHRHGAAGAPPGFQHRNAVHLRQADVEDDGVVGLALAEIMALLAVEGAVDDVAGIGQRGGELPIEIGIVLDNKKAQKPLRSALAHQRATGGVDGNPRHFAIMRKDCQQIDEPVLTGALAVAEPRPDHRTGHSAPGGVHGGGKPDQPARLGFGPAFFLVETGMLGHGCGMDGVRCGVMCSALRGVLCDLLGARRRQRQNAGENGESGKAWSRGCHGIVLKATH